MALPKNRDEDEIGSAVKGARDRAKKTKKEAKESAESGQRYLRLDLNPDTGEDLRGFVADESHRQGTTRTKYIQALIAADRDRVDGEEDDRRKKLSRLLAKVPDKDIPTLETIIKKFCK